MSTKTYLYQIYYDKESFDSIEKEFFIPLNNTDGKEGWFEFWPILKFLRETKLEEGAKYGFFSPRFQEKTGQSIKDIRDQLEKGSKSNVIVFSYDWPSICLYKNAWEQGEIFHPGLIEASRRFLSSIDGNLKILDQLGTFKTTVFSNYLVADANFWKEWRELAEEYLAYVEAQQGVIFDNSSSSHVGVSRYYLRTFVQERLSCYILENGDFIVSYPSYAECYKVSPSIPENKVMICLLRACEIIKRSQVTIGPVLAEKAFRLSQWLAFRAIDFGKRL